MTPPSSSWEYIVKMVMDGADVHRQSVLALIRTKSTLKAASIACGRNHGYFHQYLFQSKPRFLPEDVRIKLAQYLGIAENRLREPELFVNSEPPSSQAPEARPRLMVYGRGADSGIDMVTPVAEVDCPPSLLRVVDAFAAYVHNPDGVTREWIESGGWEVEVAWTRYPARVQLEPFNALLELQAVPDGAAHAARKVRSRSAVTGSPAALAFMLQKRQPQPFSYCGRGENLIDKSQDRRGRAERKGHFLIAP